MIYKCKTENISPKDFINYQKLVDLFINVTDGNINPSEVLKIQMNFKSDLGETKKGNWKLKSKDQIKVIENVENFFWFKRKNRWFF